ncbi:VOC family protein [Actinomadura barringtoniae]|uniref:VOC family protein n=2 Tax=Actinomadura barringtoniae TaxID=1427535 RepID=A0A939PIC7_9ACTN|nr:VOC family protein [Actinomadura barringtoniae]MBO2449086.1 VOC family protein [Actinomadura barringtoniae]
MGDYRVFTLGDVQGPEVAGMQALADDAQRPSWACYFRTDDVQGTVDLIKAEGGHELVPVTDVSDLGQMALCADAQGAEFALWKPGNMGGAGVVDEPAAMCWVELACRDVEEARRFYGKVFGWTAVGRNYHSSLYTNFKVGDWSVAGMVLMDERWPPHYPAHWIPYFWVEDCDASAERAVELGGKLRIPPTDIQPGRYAMMTDPTGARLAIISPAPGEGRARPPL